MVNKGESPTPGKPIPEVNLGLGHSYNTAVIKGPTFKGAEVSGGDRTNG